MTYTLPRSNQKVQANPGQYIHCNVFYEMVRVDGYVGSYAWPVYQAQSDGSLRKIA